MSLSGNLNRSRTLCESHVSVGLKIVPLLGGLESGTAIVEGCERQCAEPQIAYEYEYEFAYWASAMAASNLIRAAVLPTYSELL